MKVLKFISDTEVSDGEAPVFIFILHLFKNRCSFVFSSAVACLDWSKIDLPLILCVVKGSHLQKKSVASSILWWCLAMRGGQGILGMVLWCPGLIRTALSCMMDIWGPYMSSALMMLSVAIGQFLIWFFWLDSCRVCVDGHSTSFWSIITLSNPFIYCLWKYDLLLYNVTRKV